MGLFSSTFFSFNTPNIKYIVYGNKKTTPLAKHPNVIEMGWVSDVRKILEKSSCLLRLTIHDGFPKSIIEFICSGRYVITNHKYPYCKLYTDVNTITDTILSKPIIDKTYPYSCKIKYSFNEIERLVYQW